MRSLAINKDNLDNQRNAVQEERRLGVDNQPYGKTQRGDRRAGLRQLRLQALGDRLDGRPERRVDAAMCRVLPDLLRAEQRGARDRRRRARPPMSRELARKYFESIPSQPRAAARGHDRAGADRRAPADARRCARAAARASTSLSHSSRRSRRTTTRSTVLTRVLSERPQLAVLREHRPPEAAQRERRRLRRRQPRTAPLSDRAPRRRPASPSRTSRRRSTPRSRRSRRGRSPTGRSRRRATGARGSS